LHSVQYTKVSNNIMQFDGLETKVKAQGVLGLLSCYNSTNNTTSAGGTLIFHEEVPNWKLPLPGNLSVPFYAEQ